MFGLKLKVVFLFFLSFSWFWTLINQNTLSLFFSFLFIKALKKQNKIKVFLFLHILVPSCRYKKLVFLEFFLALLSSKNQTNSRVFCFLHPQTKKTQGKPKKTNFELQTKIYLKRFVFCGFFGFSRVFFIFPILNKHLFCWQNPFSPLHGAISTPPEGTPENGEKIMFRTWI